MRIELALFLFLAACHGDPTADGSDANVKIAKVNLVTSSSGTVPPPTRPDQATVCRVIGAVGSMHHDALTSDGGAIINGEIIGDSFTELTAGARLSLKNGSTTREMIFEGPGAVRACINGEEEMWLQSGVFESVVGAGESPGAEVWMITPHVVVRYGSGAHVRINAGVAKADVQLGGGGAFAYAMDSVSVRDAGAPPQGVDGWYPIPVGTVLSFASKKSAAQAVGDCETAAKAAHDIAIQIASRDASLSDLAPKHVVARQHARAVCAIAELLAVRSLDAVERERLLPRARASNAKWRDSSGNP